MYKINFYVPESHLEDVKQALFSAGAGRIGNYDSCCWQTKGLGQDRGRARWPHHTGQQGIVEQVEEYKVELVCSKKNLKQAIEALLKSHPYEEPAYEIYPIINPDELMD